ncbi:hypothetical protein PR048_002791 [Dryococelus australis]|uniref:Uncharacterized protein n=1 Tax=Dryococelus australis TaxID=614101 RepID=A0ABQ9IMP8_9NEOP|nr:hypothetical protein PR048_002791 [Dryococelus australis]
MRQQIGFALLQYDGTSFTSRFPETHLPSGNTPNRKSFTACSSQLDITIVSNLRAVITLTSEEPQCFASACLSILCCCPPQLRDIEVRMASEKLEVWTRRAFIATLCAVAMAALREGGGCYSKPHQPLSHLLGRHKGGGRISAGNEHETDGDDNGQGWRGCSSGHFSRRCSSIARNSVTHSLMNASSTQLPARRPVAIFIVLALPSGRFNAPRTALRERDCRVGSLSVTDRLPPSLALPPLSYNASLSSSLARDAKPTSARTSDTLVTCSLVRKGVTSELCSSQWRNDAGWSMYITVKVSLMPSPTILLYDQQFRIRNDMFFVVSCGTTHRVYDLEAVVGRVLYCESLSMDGGVTQPTLEHECSPVKVRLLLERRVLAVAESSGEFPPATINNNQHQPSIVPGTSGSRRRAMRIIQRLETQIVDWFPINMKAIEEMTLESSIYMRLYSLADRPLEHVDVSCIHNTGDIANMSALRYWALGARQSPRWREVSFDNSSGLSETTRELPHSDTISLNTVPPQRIKCDLQEGVEILEDRVGDGVQDCCLGWNIPHGLIHEIVVHDNVYSSSIIRTTTQPVYPAKVIAIAEQRRSIAWHGSDAKLDVSEVPCGHWLRSSFCCQRKFMCVSQFLGARIRFSSSWKRWTSIVVDSCRTRARRPEERNIRQFSVAAKFHLFNDVSASFSTELTLKISTVAQVFGAAASPEHSENHNRLEVTADNAAALSVALPLPYSIVESVNSAARMFIYSVAWDKSVDSTGDLCLETEIFALRDTEQVAQLQRFALAFGIAWVFNLGPGLPDFSFPWVSEITPGEFWDVGIASDNAAGRPVFSGSPVSPELAFRRCSILTSFHPNRLPRPRSRLHLGAAYTSQHKLKSRSRPDVQPTRPRPHLPALARAMMLWATLSPCADAGQAHYSFTVTSASGLQRGAAFIGEVLLPPPKWIHNHPSDRCLSELEETGDPRENPPTASSGTIPACENLVTRPEIEPSSPWWEASALTAQPPPLLKD